MRTHDDDDDDAASHSLDMQFKASVRTYLLLLVFSPRLDGVSLAM
jgi:hypothetical protein